MSTATETPFDRKHARAIAAIHEAGREIAATLDLDRTLHLVMEKAAETLPIDAGILFVFDEARRRFVVAVSHNITPTMAAQITFGFDEGVPGWAIGHQSPLLIDDVSADARVHPLVVAAGVRSLLALPLICRERVVGVLNLFCQSGTHAFDANAVQLAQVFADQAAVFLENARLVAELRQWGTQLEQRIEQRTRQLREKQAQVIQAEKLAALGRLSASIAHEINNPLQAIAINLQLLADELPAVAGSRRLHVVQQEFERIAAIVGRLLDFQRPQRSSPQRVDVLAALDEVLLMTEKQLERAGVILRRSLPGALPSVPAARNQLKQIFLNLVLNAAEAMSGGGVLTVTAWAEPARVGLSFADTGPGLTPETKAHLFEPFFTTKDTGSGLGLAISHEIAANHGGQLIAANRLNGGALFTLFLPLNGPESMELS